MSPEAVRAPTTVATGGHCWSPQRGPGGGAAATSDTERVRAATTPPPTDLLELSGSRFWMGSDENRYPDDGESPSRPVHVDGFRIAAHTVSNADFAPFIAATGYVTTAEREGWSFVFGGLMLDDFPPTRAVTQAPWWRQVAGAAWLHPEGPASDLDDRSDHPVVHVSGSTRGRSAVGRGAACPRRSSGGTQPATTPTRQAGRCTTGRVTIDATADRPARSAGHPLVHHRRPPARPAGPGRRPSRARS
jgi:hypothetical protein